MPYRIAVVEDEKGILEKVCTIAATVLDDHGCSCTLTPFSNSFELDDLFYDAFLLDISMPGFNGLELAKQIRKAGNLCNIIFISGLEDKVFDALRVQPLRFVRKNYLDEELPEAILALISELREKAGGMLHLTLDRQAVHIQTSRILYIESANKHQNIVLQDRILVVRHTIRELEEMLVPHGFFRIHRCYLVNINAVSLIGKQEVLLENGQSIICTAKKAEELKEKMERMFFL
jgi:DNA-binding LytR/AlgR family response regulator